MISGRCMCGKLRYRTKSKMLWALICHCEDCQRAAGADYVSWFGVPTPGLIWDGPRKTHGSSKGVTRSFCENCGTPMSYEAERMPGETHLYAPSLDNRSAYRPTAHIYWSEHVPWAVGAAILPRHEKGLQSPVLEVKPLV